MYNKNKAESNLIKKKKSAISSRSVRTLAHLGFFRVKSGSKGSIKSQWVVLRCLIKVKRVCVGVCGCVFVYFWHIQFKLAVERSPAWLVLAKLGTQAVRKRRCLSPARRHTRLLPVTSSVSVTQQTVGTDSLTAGPGCLS